MATPQGIAPYTAPDVVSTRYTFVDVVRTLDPAAVLLTTTAYADRVVQAPLVVPDTGWSAPPALDLPRRPGTGRLLPTKLAD